MSRSSLALGHELIEELEALGVDTSIQIPETLSEERLLRLEQIRDAQALRGAGRSDTQVERIMGWPEGEVMRMRKDDRDLWALAMTDSIERANRLTGYVACQAISLMNKLELKSLKTLEWIIDRAMLGEATESKVTAASNACRGILTYAGKLREHAMANAKVDETGELRPSLSSEFAERVRRSMTPAIEADMARKRERDQKDKANSRARPEHGEMSLGLRDAVEHSTAVIEKR